MELDVTMSQNRVEFALLFYDISEGVALSDHQAGSGPFVHIVELVLQSDEIPLKNCNCHSWDYKKNLHQSSFQLEKYANISE